ncbi:glycerol-3-phosphate acyltransferase [Paenibacillus sp. GM2]|uniref:glycerol-3-phosphate acyltransferase n=1 Tax=Paenibacillus sp. GM2 TaxID=1622070 RepID=UPI0008384CFF|nr:glycerol-3-phosphate acyltransferase [Paenibacillus sp. GM2]
MTILLTVTAFLSGSLMFSYWLGRAASKDIRREGDGNPGAFNLWHAAGYRLGLLGVVLDFAKGYLPLLLMLQTGLIEGYESVYVAPAFILGHVFSPFLKFKGGKAIAVTFGVWSALTRFEGALAYALVLALMKLCFRWLPSLRANPREADGFQVVAGFLIILIYIALIHFSMPLLYIWGINFAILLFTNRRAWVSFLKSHSADQTTHNQGH